MQINKKGIAIMKSKKILSLLFIIQLILCLSFTVFASEPTDASDLSYTVEYENSAVISGDTFKVYIRIAENTGFLNSIVHLRYDPDVLTYVDASTADNAYGEDKVSVRNPQSNGTVIITVGEMDDIPDLIEYTDTGLVAEVSFKVTDPTYEGEFELTLEATKGNVAIIDPEDPTAYTSAALVEGWNISGDVLSLFAINGATHTHTEEVLPAVDATCTEDGLTEGKKCSVCGMILVQQQVIPATGHTEVDLPEQPATCTEDGLTAGRVCSVCNEVFSGREVIPATGHTEEVLPAVEATCTEDGLTEGKKCSVCDTILVEQNVIPATGHTEVTLPGKDATCTEDGLTEGKECSVCGDIIEEQQTIPATGHTYDNDCDPDCNVCGATRTVQHSFGEWTVTKEATETAAGEEQRTCSICGTVETNVIPILERSGLSTGAIVAIVLIVIVVLAGGGFSVYWFIIRKKDE